MPHPGGVRAAQQAHPAVLVPHAGVIAAVIS
jgi:hypothetical protein